MKRIPFCRRALALAVALGVWGAPLVGAGFTAEEEAVAQRVRSRLETDDTLSPLGKSVTLKMENGKLKLLGSVASVYEDTRVKAIAMEEAGESNVEDGLTFLAE